MPPRALRAASRHADSQGPVCVRAGSDIPGLRRGEPPFRAVARRQPPRRGSYQGSAAQMVLPPSGIGLMWMRVASRLITNHPHPPVPSVQGVRSWGSLGLRSVTQTSRESSSSSRCSADGPSVYPRWRRARPPPKARRPCSRPWRAAAGGRRRPGRHGWRPVPTWQAGSYGTGDDPGRRYSPIPPSTRRAHMSRMPRCAHGNRNVPAARGPGGGSGRPRYGHLRFTMSSGPAPDPPA